MPSLLISWILALVVRQPACAWDWSIGRGIARSTRTASALRRRAGDLGRRGCPAGDRPGAAVAVGAAYRDDPAGGTVLASAACRRGADAMAEFIEPHLPGMASSRPICGSFLAAATVLMVLGLVDDVRKLDWRFRLTVELLVAAAVVFGRGWKLTLFVDWPLVTGADQRACGSWGWSTRSTCSTTWTGWRPGVAAIAAAMLAVVMLSTPEPDARQPQLFVAGFLFLLVGASLGFLYSQPAAGAALHGRRRQLFRRLLPGRHDDSGHVLRQRSAAARHLAPRCACWPCRCTTRSAWFSFGCGPAAARLKATRTIFRIGWWPWA